jgi:polyisoprenoid-binding protein YceI
MTTAIPGYLAGTWTIDPVHSEVGFMVRHLMVSKVRGKFKTFEGTIVTAEDPLQSTLTAEIDLASIDTGNEQRDGHIKSADFFDIEKYPKMTYSSTSITPKGDAWVIDGDLTLHGVTKSIPLLVELNGFGPDPYGGTRAGFSALAELSRSDFGIDISMPMDGGGVVVGDKVTITIEVEAVLQ